MPYRRPLRRATWRLRLAAGLLALPLLTLPPALASPPPRLLGPEGTPSSTPRLASDLGGVDTVTGTVTITNPLIGRAFSQPFINLTDLTAFVERDLLLPLPSPVQQTANLEGELHKGATFRLPLPIRPEGQTNNVAHDVGGPGVQIYAVDFQVNTAGDPFLDPIEMHGWPTALASLKVAVGTNEVEGGQMVVWAADDKELFPTGYGPDRKLFTEDDPVGPIPPGWTVVDLNEEPFRQIRDPEVAVPMLEGEIGLKDLSKQSFTQAFDALVGELRRRYPFTAYKGLDWDAIAAAIRPEVERAERANDQAAFNIALMRLAVLMNDGHVAVDPPDQYVFDRYGGGVGMAVGKTDTGDVVVRCVVPDSPAARAGIAPGATIVDWDGMPAADAAARTEQISSESTPLGLELQQLNHLTRLPVGTSVDVTYRNPDQSAEASAKLKAVRDLQGIVKPCGLDLANPAELPVSVEVLPSGIGYVKIDTFADDLIMMTQTWEWALREFRQLNVPALIVDIRKNGGGVSRMPLYFAGSFYDQPFTLGDQIFIDEAGNEVVSAIDRVEPAPVQWRRPVAVLIGSDCVSACELFAAAMARDSNHLIVGREPTAGVEGGVFPWLLPGDLSFRAPLIAFHDLTGKVFLEGTGVKPNVRVPTTAESLLLPEPSDSVRAAAEAALQPQIAAQQQGRGGNAKPPQPPAAEATPTA